MKVGVGAQGRRGQWIDEGPEKQEGVGNLGLAETIRDQLESSRSTPGQHGETPSLLKRQKLAGHGGMHLWPSYMGG